MDQRFGFGFHLPARKNGCARIWIHAASVGEVQAARVIIYELRSQGKQCEFFLSTMTRQGREVAGRQLPPGVTCLAAPLDIPAPVRRFLSAVEPDLYVCMETELWPAMFTELHKSAIPSVVLNGRMTERSFNRYRMVRGLMSRLLKDVDAVAAISWKDGERFRALGAPANAISVTGNIKYDYPAVDIEPMRQYYRSVLQAGEDEVVFICGSTRSGEEEILSPVFRSLCEQEGRKVLWVIAPRHLERIGEVQRFLAAAGFAVDLYSILKDGVRTCPVVLVDTMGDLGQLYSAGDLNFVGGSLVSKRGHNIMEAARWGRPVYYGPSIEDFSDAAEILEKEGGGFRAVDGNALVELLLDHLRDKEAYRKASVQAARAVSLQQGAAARQAEILLNLLPVTGKNE